jgi:uncharacterized protein YbaP (TraB family)
MNRKLGLSFLLLLSISFSQAQLLWKITGKGLKHPSYLFGTHNLISIQFLDSVPGLFKAFNDCDVVVGETVINNIDATAKIQQAAIMPNHQDIKDLLNDEQVKVVDTELKTVMKFGIKGVSIMNPSLIQRLYKTELYKKRTGFKDDNQSESYFQLVATEKDKKVIGLETPEQQIKILYGNEPLESQADLLVETILHKDTVLNKMIKSNKLYKAGNINELVELSQSKDNISNMSQAAYIQQIDNRNADWIAKLPAIIKDSSCFITLDAVYLGGNNGLIKLFEKAGYRVKAVE